MTVETLRQKQSRFGRKLPRLLDYIDALGYQFTLGELSRSPAQAEINAIGTDGREMVGQLVEKQFPYLAQAIRGCGNGVRNSLHTKCLAVDLKLYAATGEYLTDSAAYQALGEHWEGLGADHRWGGRFAKPDGGHFSIEHEGVR